MISQQSSPILGVPRVESHEHSTKGGILSVEECGDKVDEGTLQGPKCFGR